MKSKSSDEHFCILPWIHFAIMPSGEVYSCCRSDFVKPLGHFKTQNLNEIWNGDEFKHLRLEMMQNKKIAACQDCYNQEKVGHKSLRQISNEEWSDEFPRLEQTQPDGSLKDNLTPIHLDLRFTNICNFKCRTCGSDFSTSWYSDCQKLGVKDYQLEFTTSDKKEELWAELKAYLPSVRRVYFAGGEPLMHDDHYRLLEELIKLEHCDVRLTYNTNLSVLSFKKQSVLDLWKHFDDIYICASLDGIGAQGEYVRHGLDWNNFKMNRELIKRQFPKIKFNLYWTLSVFNVFHIVDAFKFFIEENFIESGLNFEVNILNDPSIYCIKILNQSEREQLKLHYKNFIDNYLMHSQFEAKEEFAKILSYILAYLDEGVFQKERKAFWLYTRQLDRLRGENLLKLFPELQNLMLEPLANE
ncbi:MAG: twitch domain-containing radical SAM protein [Bacteriovoracia bacterium]